MHRPTTGYLLARRLDQPPDAGRKRREELVQLDLYRRIGPDERNGDRHQQDRQAETDRIGCPAAGAAATGLEHEGTKPLGPLCERPGDGRVSCSGDATAVSDARGGPLSSG